MMSLSLFLVDFMPGRITYTGLAPEKRASQCISVIDLPSQVVLVVKNPPASAGDTRDTGLIPESGRFPGGEGTATHSRILAWRIPMDRGAWRATVKSQTQLS